MSVTEWVKSRSRSARRGRAKLPPAPAGGPAGHGTWCWSAAPRGSPPAPRRVAVALRRTHARTDQRAKLSQEGNKQTSHGVLICKQDLLLNKFTIELKFLNSCSLVFIFRQLNSTVNNSPIIYLLASRIRACIFNF